MEKDKEFLEYVVRSIVDNPDAVRIERSMDAQGVFLKLWVDQADMGKVIGREGNTADAIRILLKVVGMKHDARVSFKIEEPEGSSRATKTIDDVVEEM